MRIMVVVSLLLGLSQMLFAQEITQKVLPEAMRSSLNCQKINTKKALTLEEVVMIALCNNPQTTIAWQSALYQAALADMSESEFSPHSVQMVLWSKMIEVITKTAIKKQHH